MVPPCERSGTANCGAVDLTDLSRFLRAISESAAGLVLPEVRAAVGIVTERCDDLPLGASRFFGVPDMPAEMPWPSWAAPDGVERQLGFVAQINVADLPDSKLGGFKGGWLLFFWCEEALGLSPGDRTGHRVVHVPAGAALERRAGGVNGGGHQAHLTFTETLTLPADTSDHFQETSDVAPGLDAYAAIDAVITATHPSPAHWLLGNPAPIQHDPLMEAEAAQMGLYDNPASSNADWDQAVERGKERVLLLQVDSDDSLNVMWGDAGTIYFSVSAADLAAGRTESSWLTYQCF